MKNSLLDPNLPLRAFQRDARGHIKPQGGGKGDAPATPDYTGLAKQQAADSLAAAKYSTQANRANQVTPYGNLTWTNDRTFDQSAYDQAMQQYQQQLAAYNNGVGANNNSAQLDGRAAPNVMIDSAQDAGYGSPASNYASAPTNAPAMPNKDDYYNGGDNWTQTITLSPEMQALLDQQMNLQQGLFGAQNSALDRVNASMGQGFDMSSLPAGGTALDVNSLPSAGTAYDPNLATNNATDLIMQRINPQLDRQNEALRAQLANQGITQGSQAYSTAMNNFGQTRNDAQNQAALAGINLGMQQQGQTFSQQQALRQLAAALQNQQFGQSQNARSQALQEQAYLRELPLNELNALRSGNSVSMPQFPGYAQQPIAQTPNLLGAANATYQGQLGAYNADQAAGASTLGGLMGIGALALGSPTGLFGALGSGNLTGASLLGSTWGPTYNLR